MTDFNDPRRPSLQQDPTTSATTSSDNTTFHGLTPRQALVVVSHVREEIPDIVNEYIRLAGEEEFAEDGRGVEMGRCEDGALRTVEGWSRIWGLRI